MNYEIEMLKYARELKIISNNKQVGIEHKKNISTTLMGAEIFLDNDGFRGQNKPRENKKKILMLGDSMTFGWGAKKTFTEILNDKIDKYEVLNGGIGNTNTKMQIANFFENFSSKYQYKAIVLNFFINDFEDVKIRKPNFFQKYSFLYTFLSNKFSTIFIKLNLKKDWTNFYSENYSDSEMKKETFIQIKRLNDFCLKNEIRFIIHNIPELRNLKDYRFNKETNIIKDFANKNDIYFLDSIIVLKNYNEKDLWVTKLDPHANDNAHKIIANFLLNELNSSLDMN
tara:strand:- start:1282 stop:2133 length:852 start_codon:yes stop_codon:yes gene_type:complete